MSSWNKTYQPDGAAEFNSTGWEKLYTHPRPADNGCRAVLVNVLVCLLIALAVLLIVAGAVL